MKTLAQIILTIALIMAISEASAQYGTYYPQPPVVNYGSPSDQYGNQPVQNSWPRNDWRQEQAQQYQQQGCNYGQATGACH